MTLQALSDVMSDVAVAEHTPDLTLQTLPLELQETSVAALAATTLAGKQPTLLMLLRVIRLLDHVGLMGKSLGRFLYPRSKEACEGGYVPFLASWTD